MVNWVVGQRTGGLIVDEEMWVHEIKVSKQGTEPDNVLCGIVSSDVLSLRGCGNNLLTMRHPNDRCTNHEHHGTRDGATSDRTRGSIAVGVGVHVNKLVLFVGMVANFKTVV
jgi:hypothetical protein